MKSEPKAMVRRLPGRARGLIANSPLRVGAQTCIRLSRSEKFLCIYALINQKTFLRYGSLTKISGNTGQKRVFLAFTSYFSDNEDLLAERSGFEHVR